MSRNVAKIFGTAKVVKVTNTVNKEQYPAFTKDVKESYIQMLMTNTLGNVYYTNSEDLLKESHTLHKQVCNSAVNFMASALVYARNYGYMRTQPILGLVYLAGSSAISKALFTGIFNSVIKTPNDLIDFVTMLKSIRGNEGGRRIKEVVGNWLVANLSEYWIIKYGAEKPGAYSLADLVKIYHPAFGINDSKIAYLLGKEANFGETSQILWYTVLKAAIEDATKILAIKRGRLPHEVASTFAGSSKEVWKAIAEEMPTFALLRNLVNIERRDLVKDLYSVIKNKLTNKEILTKAKIMPFQMYNAFEQVHSAEVKDLLRLGIENTFENLPDLGNNVAIALDRSGSMNGTFLTIGSIFGIALAKKTGFNSKFYTFNTVAKEENISKVDSILTQAERIQAGGGTNQSSVIETMIASGVSVDTIIMITDEQQNTGNPLYTVLEKYKKFMHKPNLKVYIINVSPYHMAALTPMNEKNYYYIYGWSDRILEFIALTKQGFSTIAAALDTYDV